MNAPAIVRRRARFWLAGLAAGLLAMAVLLASLVIRQLTTHPPAAHVVVLAPAHASRQLEPAERELARRPMPVLPLQAAQPQPLASHPAADRFRLPVATGEAGGVPTGLPPSALGAIAALAAMDTQGLRGGDPDTYAQAYNQFAASGAPPAAASRLGDMLASMRSSAGLAPTGPVPDLTITWQPTEAQIKGVLDQGRFVVVCVLGQLTADYQGRDVTVGAGDCQAMRFTNGQWRISPGQPAAPAPDAWPGSQDAVNAGYKEIA